MVFDYSSNKIWIGGNRTLQSFKYNFDVLDPRIIPYESFYVEDDQIHDIFPIMNSDYLWFTTLNYIYIFNHKTGSIMKYYQLKDVKSISSLPIRNNLRSTRSLNDLENQIDPANIQNMYMQGRINKWKNELRTQKVLNNTRSRKAIGSDNYFKDFRSLKTIFVVPKIQWWTDEIKYLDTNERLFFKNGAQIYKGKLKCKFSKL